MSRNNSNFCFFDTAFQSSTFNLNKYLIDRLIGSIKLDLK